VTLIVITALAVLATVAQIGVVPAAFEHPLAAPVLPIVLIAGWASVRSPREVWPVPLVAAVLLGAVSQARVGWYLLALLPVVALVSLLRGGEGRALPSALRRLAYASTSGTAGAVAYVVILALTAGDARVLAVETGPIMMGAAWTGTLAAGLAALLWPLRTQETGLFA
jgi:hypothetical protein